MLTGDFQNFDGDREAVSAIRFLFDDNGKDDCGDLFLCALKGEALSLYDGPLELEAEGEGKDIRDYTDIAWTPQIWKDEM